MKSPQKSPAERPRAGRRHAIGALSLAAACALGGCSLFQRDRNAPNQERPVAEQDAAIDDANPRASARVRLDERTLLAQRVFERGVAAHGKGDYEAASKIFTGFIEDYPGAAGFEDAHMLLGESLFHLGRYAEAEGPLKRVVENSIDREIRTRALLMLAESLHMLKRDDEALATTFQVVPDKDLQARLALPPHAARRQAKDPKAPLADQVRAYLLQASILGALDDHKNGDAVFSKGKRLLSQATGYGISKTEARTLRGELGWREMGILGRQCSEKTHIEKGSEEAIAGALQGFYRCIEPAKGLLCDIARDAPAPLLQRAKEAYKALVRKPLELKNALPMADSPFKDEDTKARYEEELRNHIDRTVEEKTADFRNLDECGLPGIF